MRVHFGARLGRDLLVLGLGAGQGWPELCAFLGRPIPEAAFPHLNCICRFTRTAITWTTRCSNVPKLLALIY